MVAPPLVDVTAALAPGLAELRPSLRMGTASMPALKGMIHGARILFPAAGLASLVLILRQWQRGLRLDWDIDAFLMMAWRFIQGEWLYIDFYDPKWPHVPLAYLPGALSGSLLVHLLVSWLVLLATGLAITGFGRAAAPRRLSGVDTSVAAGVLYVLLTPLLPGGPIGHLAVYANACLAVGMWGLAARWRDPHPLAPLAGGLAIGLGVGLRPNLVIPVVAVGLAALSRSAASEPHRGRLASIAAGFTLGVAGPFLPYLFRDGGAQAAWLGGFVVLGDWNRAMYPPLSARGFFQELTVLYNPRVLGVPGLVLTAGGAALLLLSGLRQGHAGRRVLLLFGLWQAALWLSYALSHIHHHYLLMDLAGFCLALAALPAARLRALSLALLIALLAAVLFHPLKPLSALDHQRLRDEALLVRWLGQHSPGRFQSPDWLGPHWRLHTPQATKAVHPVWSLQLLDSPLNQAASVRSLGLANTWPDRCAEWLATQPTALVLRPGTAARCPWDQHPKVRDISQRVGLSPASDFRVFSMTDR